MPMSPEQIKAYFANPENNPGPGPYMEDEEWTPEMLAKMEQALRNAKRPEADVEGMMKYLRGLAERQRVKDEEQ